MKKQKNKKKQEEIEILEDKEKNEEKQEEIEKLEDEEIIYGELEG